MREHSCVIKNLVAAWIILTTAILSLVACGNKGSNSSSAPVVVPQQGSVYPNVSQAITSSCAECGGLVNELYRGDSQSFSGVISPTTTLGYNGGLGYVQAHRASLIFFGDAASANSMIGQQGGIGGTAGVSGVVSLNSFNPVSYNGSVAAQGWVTVGSQWAGSLCNIPSGTYQAVTVEPGQWISAIFSGIRLRLSGQIQIEGSLSGMVGAKSAAYQGLTWQEVPTPRSGSIYGGQFFVESVNGSPCSSVIMF